MKQHLTNDQISQWLVEGPGAGFEAHLQGCWSCQAKLAQARAPLTVFREAVLAWSEAEAVREGAAAAQETGTGSHARPWWPSAAFALAALLVIGISVEQGAFHRTGKPESARVQVSDAVLMDQVDSEVSEAVPDAMAPLTDLVAWDGKEGSGQSTVAANRPTKIKSRAAFAKTAKLQATRGKTE